MDSFIYSINVTLPVFFVMIIGYVLRQRHMLTEEFVSVANKFNFNVTLPALLFRDISQADITKNMDVSYVLFCAIVTSVSFFAIWGLTKILLKDKSMVGAFVQASYRSSAAVIGIAFIQNIYGQAKMAPLMIIGTVPLFNIYAVLVLTLEGGDKQADTGKALKSAGINILKNPIIIGIVAGLLASLFQMDFPVIIDKTISNLAVMASPLALVALGAGFEGKKALKKIKPTLCASAIKLLILPMIFLPIAVHMGFRTEKLVALVIMLAAPATPSCYIMAKNMNNDDVLTSSVIVTTTLLSSVTLTFWVFILRLFEYI